MRAKARRRVADYPDHIHINDCEAMVRLSVFELLACIAALNGFTSRWRKKTMNEIAAARDLERLKFKLAYVIAEKESVPCPK